MLLLKGLAIGVRLGIEYFINSFQLYEKLVQYFINIITSLIDASVVTVETRDNVSQNNGKPYNYKHIFFK